MESFLLTCNMQGHLGVRIGQFAIFIHGKVNPLYKDLEFIRILILAKERIINEKRFVIN
jgi:hypothetical protein